MLSKMIIGSGLLLALSAPASAFTCPGADRGGVPVGPAPNCVFDCEGLLLCSYPTLSAAPADFFCAYRTSDGALIQDSDESFCPGSAAEGSPLRRL